MAKDSEVSRRALLAGGVGVAGVALLALSGCSAGGSTLAEATSSPTSSLAPPSARPSPAKAKRSAAGHSTSQHPTSEHPTSEHPSTRASHTKEPTSTPSKSHPESSQPASAEPAKTKSSSPKTSKSAPAGPPPGALAKVSAIPVGGSIRATANGEPVTLAQPKSGTIACFSAICTHQGCTVNAGGPQLHCPCHGSVYNAFTGAVVHGPAPASLPRVATRIVDGYVVAG